VQTSVELVRKQAVYGTVALHEALVGKRLTNHRDLEVRLRSPGHAVHVGFVDDLQVQRLEDVFESASDSLLTVHGA
jgi:hypothetical protein